MNSYVLYSDAAENEQIMDAQESTNEETHTEMQIAFTPGTLGESGMIMLKGMVGIFVVIGVIILVVYLLNKIFAPKKEA